MLGAQSHVATLSIESTTQSQQFQIDTNFIDLSGWKKQENKYFVKYIKRDFFFFFRLQSQ